MISEYFLKASVLLALALIGLGCSESRKPVEMRSVQEWRANPQAAQDALETCIWRSGRKLQDAAEKRACDAVLAAVRKS